MREVEILFENIDEKLEDEMILITPKWISRTFDYHIRDSERLLSDYFKAHPNLSAVYLLVGLDRSGDSLVSLVPYDRMVETESRFSKILTRVIYSIQRHRCPSSCTLAGNELLLNLTTDALKKLVTIPWCPADQMRPPLTSCENTTDTIETSSTIQRLNIIGKDDNIKTKELRNFFAPAPKPTVVTIMPTEGPTKASSNVLETRIAQTIPAVIETSKQTPIPTTITPSDQDDDDDHFSPGVALKSSQPKRRRLIFESDEENEDAAIVKKTPEKRSKVKQASSAKRHNFKDTSEILVEDSETDSPVTKSSRRHQKPIGRHRMTESSPPVHTAVSSPVRDRILSTKPVTSNPVTANVKPNRRKRQSLKTFTDEDGYMVTEKVWETASEDESEHEVAVERPPTALGVGQSSSANAECISNGQTKPVSSACLTGAPTLKSVPSGGFSKKVPAPKPGSKQASLSSFFKKM